ncbi:cytochrome O ubiquinol oxidase protein CyoD [Buchnera aphidicola str. Bp (Baizongia pistaciae)]|uniref:Cytochrome bo(3) ubiquinol oxidase subunit 4 n=1 Tax=Buchnera aphidicola subsp. Baizongia pistaciae (strain Bp) TaxID=224915 RepID=CYOD_BUCBP|nr:cytochrome C oxidase subunit IV family protein [Buchnera aphidicola]Q89AA6.1 RecName: Full=Cytochrome bo(3) ubiquinol oxidase subunit 4; AltName: Full=Cytochrome o ubiquinol oxidase subunit 4; Short=Cytochrome o subunit 4; AltName: Full=Oxidase bo(3) subunit 4; AltName: Full=Ubiquinol oxidase polypeptide IV; AltName: Full=Ubiquinol oxidase subunit 4 [Buchnera aphidicola str. Bp (Baizongia pistaciae)]AAO27124.1 cytochrome O ubiquinol oxidase protein CyoD [Buchnera aphidicola str. Bp (Baizongia 
MLKNRYLKYLFILILLSILSIMPIFAIIYRIFSRNYLYAFIIVCLFFQILAHIKFFLNLDFSLEQRWKLISVIFSLVVGLIILLGSIWVIKNLNNNLCIM